MVVGYMHAHELAANRTRRRRAASGNLGQHRLKLWLGDVSDE